METTDKKQEDPLKREHGAIPLPEHMDRSTKKEGNRPQATAGTHTPGNTGRRDMSEAAERKARRDAIIAKERKEEKK